MSQTLQNQILLAKSMNGIVTLSDGAGTTITNGSINTSNVNSSNVNSTNISTNNLSLSVLDLNSSLTLEQYDDIDTGTGVGLVSLWEKGYSYFNYLPKSLATPTLDSELITRLFANNNYGRLTISNTWTGTNNDFTGTNITATTQATNTDSTTKVATTAFTQSAINRLLYFNATSSNQMFFNVQFPLLTSGARNIGIGDCFRKVTSASDNVCVGSASANNLTTGLENFILGGLSGRNISSGSFNVVVGVDSLANGNVSECIAIGRYCLRNAQGNDNTCIGYFSGVQIGTGTGNSGVGAYSHLRLLSGSNNSALGYNSGNHILGSQINASNNTYIGAETYMSGGTTFSNSTCLGYNSRITASNSIFLGTANETTFAMGGLNIPTGELLTLVGNIFANSTTITPAQLSLLSTLSGSLVDTGSNQTITGIKSFDGFDNTAPNYCGSSFVSPVMRPRLFTLANSINYSCHAFGSNAGKNLLADGTNSGCYVLGQDSLSAKTTGCFNVCSIGGANMTTFVAESFSGVTCFGQANLENENGYSLNNVTIVGGNTTFDNGGIKPTSVTNASFTNAYGISLSSSTAISNVFGFRTAQPITKSNQGIIGDSTEIILHSTNQKVIVTGGLELQNQLKSSIFSPQLNYVSANFTLTAPFKQYYHLILNAGATINLPNADATMVGQEFTIKRRGGTAGVVSLVQQNFQPIFTTGGAGLGTTGSLLSFMSATQSTAKLMCIQSHFAGSGFATLTASATTIQIVSAWNTLPSSFITIGTRLTIAGVTRRVTAFAGGTGGLGNYTIDSAYSASAITNQPVTSTDQFGWDILYVQ